MDALQQVIREVMAERYAKPLPDYKPLREGEAPAVLVPLTAEQQDENRRVAARESRAYDRAHPSQRDVARLAARDAEVRKITATHRARAVS